MKNFEIKNIKVFVERWGKDGRGINVYVYDKKYAEENADIFYNMVPLMIRVGNMNLDVLTEHINGNFINSVKNYARDLKEYGIKNFWRIYVKHEEVWLEDKGISFNVMQFEEDLPF